MYALFTVFGNTLNFAPEASSSFTLLESWTFLVSSVLLLKFEALSQAVLPL